MRTVEIDGQVEWGKKIYRLRGWKDFGEVI